MGKVYMRADENAARAMVMESPAGEARVACPGRVPHYYSDSEASAVVEGLLRRMLERETRTYEISALEAAIAVVREGR